MAPEVCASERVQPLLAREVHVAAADALAPAHAEAHRREHGLVVLHVVRAEAADEIEAALDTGIALEQRCRVLQVVDQHEHLDGIRAEAIGYLLKDTSGDNLAEAVRGALRGESQIDPTVARKVLREFQQLTSRRSAAPQPVVEDEPLERLTDREEEVLKLLAGGLANKEIAQQLSLSEGTVKNHISAILTKLHANDRTQAVLTALKRGLVDLK